jgi:prophage regulatory protein
VLSTDRLIDKKELRDLVPYHPSHIARLEKAGEFPARIRIGRCRVAWSFHDVQTWIAARKAETFEALNGKPK